MNHPKIAGKLLLAPWTWIGILLATVAVQGWRLGNAKEAQLHAEQMRQDESAAHNTTRSILAQAQTANAKYREVVFTLERANTELAAAKSAVEAQTAAKVKEAEARRRDADRTLAAFMTKYHAAVRDARCGPILATDLKECLK